MLVLGAALAASLAGLGNELVQDDVSLLVESSRLHGLSRWREILSGPYWPPPHSPDLYRPLTSLLLGAEYSLGGGSPLMFRVFSYLLHAGVAVAVLGLASRILPRAIALAAAVVFAAHPVHVEAVALAVGQSELLVGLFGTLMTIRYLDRRRTGTGELRFSDWAWLGLFYLLAGLSKEQGLLLPAILVGAELLFFRETQPVRERFRRLVPGLVLLAGIGVTLLMARRAALGGTVAGTFTAPALVGLDFGKRLFTMLAVVPEWARLLLWPVHLQADYSLQEIIASTGFGGREALGLLLVLAAGAAAWLSRRKAPPISFGLIWMAVALFPVSNLLISTGVVLAERTLFLPSIGLVLALGGVLGLAASAKAWSPAAVRAGLGALGVVAVALVVRSAERQRVWRNDAELRIRSAADAPRSWRTQLSYASYLFEAGRRDSALDRYDRALRLAPPAERWRVRNDLAEHFFAVEEADRAVEQLRASLADAPGQEQTRHYLVLGLLTLGAYREAAAEADSALAGGGAHSVFDELRVLADSARRLGVPPGGVRIRVRSLRQ